MQNVVRLSVLERVVQQLPSPNQQAPPANNSQQQAQAQEAVYTGLQITKAMVNKQPLDKIAPNGAALQSMIESLLSSRNRKMVGEFGLVMRAVVQRLDAPGANVAPGWGEVQLVRKKLEEVVVRLLHSAASESSQQQQQAPGSQPAAAGASLLINSPPAQMQALCGSLATLEAMESVAGPQYLFNFMGLLAKVCGHHGCTPPHIAAIQLLYVYNSFCPVFSALWEQQPLHMPSCHGSLFGAWLARLRLQNNVLHCPVLPAVTLPVHDLPPCRSFTRLLGSWVT